ncbi:MAG TPA: hypothetical protein VH374_19080 [Polyangia bacterium]|jgi:hypothetical protein|nr:hypothetical protein [Polyangia bacterium]
MLENTDEARVFEAMKDDLLRLYPGRFAVVCGHVLVGVFPSVDDALLATCGVFDDGRIPAGAPILISEIAKTVSVRVMATPSSKLSVGAEAAVAAAI